jgi:hypothetical protein
MASKAEVEFRQRFLNTVVRVEKTQVATYYSVYAGDYPCSNPRVVKADAFTEALDAVDGGLVTPDPEEVSETSYRCTGEGR